MTIDTHAINRKLNAVLEKCNSAIGRPYYSDSMQREALVFRIKYMCDPGASLIDLGGGLSPVNATLSSLGMDVIVYDLLSVYWDDKYNSSSANQRLLELMTSFGVEFIEENLETFDLGSRHKDNTVDYIVSHHCLEHFHNSPKVILESSIKALKQGGHLIIEVPNAINILKRIKILMGKTNYVSYKEFYEAGKFYGHVREYTIGDLRLMAGFLEQNNYKIFGTNYLGLKQVASILRKPIDIVLRMWPGFCAAIYIDIRVE